MDKKNIFYILVDKAYKKFRKTVLLLVFGKPVKGEKINLNGKIKASNTTA